MKEVSHTEGLLGQEQLQDISGGCNNCKPLIQACRDFIQTGHRQMEYGNTFRAAGHTNTAQRYESYSRTKFDNARVVSNALKEIGHIQQTI